MNNFYPSITCLMIVLLESISAQAGPITSNAGTNTDSNGVQSITAVNSLQFIVNIDAKQDGVRDNGGGGDGSGLNGISDTVFVPALSLTLAPGSYTLTDAYGLAGSDMTAGNNFSAWNYGQNWVWEFVGVNIPSPTNGAGTVLPNGNQTGSAYQQESTQAASAAFGVGENGTFTLTSTETIAFAIDDNGVNDNQGGVSVLVTAAAPEPSTLWLMVLSIVVLPVLGWMRRAA